MLYIKLKSMISFSMRYLIPKWTSSRIHLFLHCIFVCYWCKSFWIFHEFMWRLNFIILHIFGESWMTQKKKNISRVLYGEYIDELKHLPKWKFSCSLNGNIITKVNCKWERMVISKHKHTHTHTTNWFKCTR